jgi:tRNA uridine 5-carbamoylmethylation protein Kti12
VKVINLFAGPGCGKSTTAAGLFFLMKHEGYRVELVTEYAKDITWADRCKELNDQLYITAKQNHRQFLLRDKVDYCITDSPLLICLVYARMMPSSFAPLVKDLFQEYDNLAVTLKRVKPYVVFGRTQTEEQARELDRQIGHLVDSCVSPDKIMETDGDFRAAENIFTWIKERE